MKDFKKNYYKIDFIQEIKLSDIYKDYIKSFDCKEEEELIKKYLILILINLKKVVKIYGPII